jgi:hypothetical protein
VSAPTANAVYASCMEAAGDLLENIKSHNRDGNFTPEQRATAVRSNSDAVLKLVQTAVTLHAAAKTSGGNRGPSRTRQ